MGVNKQLPHLVVIQEDSPYRELMNGVRNALHVDGYRVDNRASVGGWPKVFAALEENIPLLLRNPQMHLLLLMDFDSQFDRRMQKFNTMIDAGTFEDRVFLLGVDNKEFENLKQTLAQSNVERIGQLLVEDCPDRESVIWQNKHLACNQSEINRMRDAGVFDWLFVGR